VLKQLTRDLTNFIYPPHCAACREMLAEGASQFCSHCAGALDSLASTPSCLECAAPIPEGSACPFCGGSGIAPFDAIAALGPFREPLRNLVHQMKYRHRWPVAEILADAMYDHPRIRKILDQTDILVPVPLHWSRQIQRGYNQADTLAHRLARRSQRITVEHPIVRLKNTPAQTAVYSAADRAANLRFAFGLVRDRQISGKRVTLVDDVITTASTLKSAARAIKQASPASIRAITVAAADPRRQDFQKV
jgi:ComF family protein